MKKITRRSFLAAMGTSAAALALTACGGGSGSTAASTASGSAASGSEAKLSGSITFTIWDNNLMTFIDENDMVGKFQEIYPDAEIEVEKIKDDSEYWNAMKMRASANQLPDVMFNKPFTLSRFKDYLLDLSDTEAAKNNALASGYALDGKVLGVPMTAGYEYVYYWKDLFKEAGVEVPTTWEELKTVSKKLQDYYSAKDADFMAIALGAKDEWPDYPYMEFMPALVNGNGQNWNDMAKTDTPFAEGSDINTAYHRAYDLFTSGVFGKDPLGLSNDQATTLFAQKKAAIIDGANTWQMFRYIQIPSIMLMVDFILFDNIRGALQVFDIPFVMTAGGPGYASSTFTLYTIKTAFTFSNFGLASTMAVAIMVIIIVVYLVQNVLIHKVILREDK